MRQESLGHGLAAQRIAGAKRGARPRLERIRGRAALWFCGMDEPLSFADRLASAPWWALAAIAAMGSLFIALAIPPWGMPGWAWLGFLPLTLVARAIAHSITQGRQWRARSIFGVGWIGGLSAGLVGFYWIALTLERFAGVGWVLAGVGLLGFSLWTAGPFGVWVLAVAKGPQKGPWALIWPIVAWIAFAELWPSQFPFTPTLGFVQMPEWIQLAEFGGVHLVETLQVGVGVLAADGCLAQHRRTRQLYWAAAVGVVAASYAYGDWRIRSLEVASEHDPVIRVGIVQPNMPLQSPDRREKMRRLWAMSAAAEADGAQMIVWPEAGIYPFHVERPFKRDLPGWRQILRNHHVPTIFGVATQEPNARFGYNSVANMDAAGQVVGLFDKTILVPFGEKIPLVDPDWARQYIPAMTHNLEGAGPARFEIHPANGSGDAPTTIYAGPLICYEDIFADLARETAAQPGGIHLFINVTIDTWFGDTPEPWEHLGLAQFRTVEHRIPMVRAIAAGASSYIDHTGTLRKSLAVTDPRPHAIPPPSYMVVDVTIPSTTAEHSTVYRRGGWLYWWLCAAIAFGGLAWALIERRRASSAS